MDHNKRNITDAKRFREARKLNKLKLIEAAKMLGVSQPTLSAWEGERKSPSIDALEKMAELYGVSTDFLLGRSDADVGDLFLSPSLFSELFAFSEQPVQRDELLCQTQIWLEPISPDLSLRNELRGWYRIKGSYAENEYGNRFHLDTYGSKWLAFKNNTQK